MAVKLSGDVRDQLVASIQQFVREELDQEIGELKAGFILDFFVDEVAPTVYNRAIADAQRHLQGKLDDLGGDLHEKEFGYWKK